MTSDAICAFCNETKGKHNSEGLCPVNGVTSQYFTPRPGVSMNSVTQAYSAPEWDEPMRLIQDDDSHWYIIPEAREGDFYVWCQAMAECVPPPFDWEPERINGVRSIRIFDYENTDK